MKYLLLLFSIFASLVCLSSCQPHQLLPSTTYPFGNQAIRGVNLGGWLIPEYFITPGFFVGTPAGDLWTYIEHNRNNPTAMARLYNHFKTYVTESDIEALGRGGLNFLRIPVGFWTWQTQAELDAHGEPYPAGYGWNLVVQVIKWAKKYNMFAMIDLHGAPGSQNGWDNSGHVGDAKWGTGDTLDRHYEVLRRMCRDILALENDPSTSNVVMALELVNEPYPGFIQGGLGTVSQFYKAGYEVVRQFLPASKYWVVISDAFDNNYWIGFMPAPQYQNVWFDKHTYHCFVPYLQNMNYEQHLQQSCQYDVNDVKQQTLPVIVGEWSVAYKIASGNAWTEPYPSDIELKRFLAQFFLAQVKGYTTYPSFGSVFWNFKTANGTAPMWDIQLGVKGGWIPFPWTDANSATACSSATTVQGLSLPYNPPSNYNPSGSSASTSDSTSNAAATAAASTAAATTAAASAATTAAASTAAASTAAATTAAASTAAASTAAATTAAASTAAATTAAATTAAAASSEAAATTAAASSTSSDNSATSVTSSSPDDSTEAADGNCVDGVCTSSSSASSSSASSASSASSSSSEPTTTPETPTTIVTPEVTETPDSSTSSSSSSSSASSSSSPSTATPAPQTTSAQQSSNPSTQPPTPTTQTTTSSAASLCSFSLLLISAIILLVQ